MLADEYPFTLIVMVPCSWEDLCTVTFMVFFPEYPAVLSLHGVGTTLGPQLIAEIGDIRRFHNRKALIAYAGIDSSPYQSGTIDIKSRGISKRGSASLRKTLFTVMDCILRHKHTDEPV